jgi:hypothetical protein
MTEPKSMRRRRRVGVERPGIPPEVANWFASGCVGLVPWHVLLPDFSGAEPDPNPGRRYWREWSVDHPEAVVPAELQGMLLG